MPTILWWILGSIGALFLLPFLWLGYRGLKFRRLQPIIFEYLALQDVEAALRYMENHPRLLTSDAEDFITVLLDRTWARKDIQSFVSGAIHLSGFLYYLRHFVLFGIELDLHLIEDTAEILV